MRVRFNLIVGLLLVLLFVPAVLGYQHSHLIFDLDDSWEAREQRRNLQSFVKDTLYVQVRVTDIEQLSAQDFVKGRDGAKVVSENMLGDVNESIVVDPENALANSILKYGGETYVITMFGDVTDLEDVKSEMMRLYKTLEFSKTQNFVLAPYEVELEYPEKMSYLEKQSFSWSSILFFLFVFLIVLYLFRRTLKGLVSGLIGKTKQGSSAKKHPKHSKHSKKHSKRTHKKHKG